MDHGVDRLFGQVDVAHQLYLPAVALVDVAQAAVELIQAGVPEEVELDETGVRYGVLVPLADVAPGHCRSLDGYLLVHAVGGNDDAAGMLAEVPRQADDLLDQR